MQTSTTRSLILSRPAVAITLFVAFAFVVGSVALSAFATQKIREADRRASEAQQTLLIIHQLVATINEAETAQRGYLLTNDDKYLAPYESAKPRYRVQLAALAKRTSGDLVRSELVAELTTSCEERFADIERTVRLRHDHGIAPALNVVESDEGWRVMNAIRQQVQSLQKYELAAIARQTNNAATDVKVLENLNIGLLVVATLLAGAAAVAVIHRLHHLEGLIKVCAWTQRVQWEGRWISFEEYLERRFNIQCTHGISDEAAQKLGRQIAETPVPPDMQHG